MALTLIKQFAPTAKAVYPIAPVVISSMSGNGTAVTVNTTAAHNLSTGDYVAIAGSSVSAFNGNFYITKTSSTQFTFASTTSGTASAPSYPVCKDLSVSGSSIQNITTLTCNGTTGIAVVSGGLQTGMQTGDMVYIQNASPVGLNGYYNITILSNTSFSFACQTSTVGATAVMTAQELYYSGLGEIHAGHIAYLPGGPRLYGDTTANSLGWSGDTQCSLDGIYGSAFYHWYDLTNGTTNGLNWSNAQKGAFVMSGFYFLNLMSTTSSNSQIFQQSTFSDGGDCMTLVWDQTSQCFAYRSNTQTTVTAVPVPTNKWIEIRTAINCTNAGSGNSNWNFLMEYRVVGQNNWTVISNQTNVTLNYYGELVYNVSMGFVGTGASPYVVGRYAMPSLMTLGSWSDASALLSTLSTPVLDPTLVNAGYTWYYDPANASGSASDSNLGLSSATPFLTANYVSQLGINAGFFNASNSNAWQTAIGGVDTGTALNLTSDTASVLIPAYVNGQAVLTGDKLIINNNSGAEIRLGEDNLQINTIGITVASSGGRSQPANLTRFKIMSSSGWSKTAGQTYVYQSADTDLNAALYQNRRTMTVATSVANCNVTPGSFYTDGNNMYVYPFGATNPASDGNCYERTQPAGNVTGGSGGYAGVLNMGGGNFVCQGISATGTTCNNTNEGYGFTCSVISNPNGTFMVWDTCHTAWWDKHGFGTVGSGSNNRWGYYNCISEGASPYGNSGGSTCYVDFVGSGTGNIAGYVGCTTGSGGNQVIGSNVFSSNGPSATYTCHGSTGGINEVFVNCDFHNGGLLGPSSGDTMWCYNCKLANQGGNTTTALTYYVGCWIYNLGNNVGGYYSNCIIQLTSSSSIAGQLISFQNCVIDYSQLGSGNFLQNTGTGTQNVSFNECLIIPGTGPIIQQVNSGDTFVSQYNEIQMPSSQVYVGNYLIWGNLTVSQSQTYGADTGSATILQAAIYGNYQRTAQASVTHPIGLQKDYTGVLFSNRMTPGAYEYISTTQGVGGGGGRGGLGLTL